MKPPKISYARRVSMTIGAADHNRGHSRRQDGRPGDIRTRLPLRSFRASGHAACVTVAVPAPKRRALGLGVGLCLACWCGVVEAAPPTEFEPVPIEPTPEREPVPA